MNEKISQLIDQELDSGQREALFDQMVKDKDACQCWQRYHFIGGVIRGEIARSDKCLADRVAAILDKEPTVLAPRPENPDLANANLASTNSANDRGDIWKSVGMFALAASLALVAVVGLQPENIVTQSKPTQTKSIVTTDTRAQGAQMAVFSKEFDEMLVEHGEFTASPALNGLIAYVKLASNQRLER